MTVARQAISGVGGAIHRTVTPLGSNFQAAETYRRTDFRSPYERRAHAIMTETDGSLLDRINQDLQDAMGAKDKVRLRTLRSVSAALKNKEITKREGGKEAVLDEQEQLAVIRKAVKQRKDSIEQYDSAGREDLVAKEQEEIDVLKEYLPQPLSDDELRRMLTSIIDDVGAESMADMGPVMGRAMSELRGRVDGSRVQKMVQELLG